MTSIADSHHPTVLSQEPHTKHFSRHTCSGAAMRQGNAQGRGFALFPLTRQQEQAADRISRVPCVVRNRFYDSAKEVLSTPAWQTKLRAKVGFSDEHADGTVLSSTTRPVEEMGMNTQRSFHTPKSCLTSVSIHMCVVMVRCHCPVDVKKRKRPTIL